MFVDIQRERVINLFEEEEETPNKKNPKKQNKKKKTKKKTIHSLFPSTRDYL